MLMVIPLTVTTVVREHVGHVISGDERIAKSNELNIFALESNSRNQTPNPSKSIDSDLDRFLFANERTEA